MSTILNCGLKKYETRNHSKIEQQIEAGIYPGASFAYYRDGEWSDCYLGEANPEIGEQTCQGLVYDLASVSKVVGVGTVLTFCGSKARLSSINP